MKRDEKSTLDEQLAQQIVQTLDESLQSLDAETQLTLALARQQAQLGKKTIKPQLRALIGIGAAASIAAVVVLPGYWNDRQMFELDDELGYLNVDPQLLEDMEMLQVLGESAEDHGSEF